MFPFQFSNTAVFVVLTSWLDTLLSLFLDTVDDSFRDFWTNACNLIGDSFFQISGSLGIIFMYYFLWVTPDI